VLPGLRAWVDEVKVPGGGNLQEMDVFFIVAGALLLACNIVAAEGNWNNVVGRAVDEPLLTVGNRKSRGISFAVVVGNLGRRPVQKFDDGVIAEMELISALQVDYSGKRNDPREAWLVGCEAKCKLTSRGVSHDHELLGIETVLDGVLP